MTDPGTPEYEEPDDRARERRAMVRQIEEELRAMRGYGEAAPAIETRG